MRTNRILIPDLLFFGGTAFAALLIRVTTDLTWTHVTELLPLCADRYPDNGLQLFAAWDPSRALEACFIR